MVPIKRPDDGGVVALRHVNIRVNHFPVAFDPHTTIEHYLVGIQPVGVTKHDRQEKISKSDMSLIRNKLFSDNPGEFPLSKTAYDGEKNIFSVIPLPTGSFTVEFPNGKMKSTCYKIAIKLENKFELKTLMGCFTGNLCSVPREILQAVDVVMKDNPTKCMVRVGRGFYPSDTTNPNDDLGYGLMASRGYRHSLKPTSQGLSLCLDSSVLAFRRPLPVIEYLKAHIDRFDARKFNNFRREVESALRGLKVRVTHRETNMKFTVAGLSVVDTKKIEFELIDNEGKEPTRRVSLIQYYKEKYNRDIAYKDIPCLDLGKRNRANFVPMELCVLVEGQIYPREQLDKETTSWLKELSLPRPREREKNIQTTVQSAHGPCSGTVVENFGLKVNTKMTKVTGRVLPPPSLKLSHKGKAINITPDRETNQWNLMNRGLTKGARIKSWVVIDFSASSRNMLNPVSVERLMDRCKSLGIEIDRHPLYERTNMNKFSKVHDLEELLQGVIHKAANESGARPQLILCVMSWRDDGYKYLKWIAETKIGVMTQCCLSNNANKCNDQYFANLALKINAKLGGSNVELANGLPFFKADDNVMFIGADVNHPAAGNKQSPSIAAVVGTVNWPAANRYAARIQAQEHRKESISNFGKLCLDLVETFARLNGFRPKKIVVFRDGVSDGQFDMVLEEELKNLKTTFQQINYFPTVSVIVVQKRHITRFFPESDRDGGSKGNVPPGTVVDTKVVHPWAFDFYLASHYGGMGTSKLTHYYLPWDEHGFSSNDLQKLIYEVCFTFSRCTKPVSLVPPVFYADLVAYRGRLYQEAIVDAKAQQKNSLADSFSSLSVNAPFDEALYKLQSELENAMFFV